MAKKLNKNRDQIYFKEVFDQNNNEHLKFMDYLDLIKPLKYCQSLFAKNMLLYVDNFEDMKYNFEKYFSSDTKLYSHSLENYKLRFGEKEGIRRYEEYCKKITNGLLELDENNTEFLINSENNKRITCRHYKFWMIKHNMSEEDAKNKVKEISKGSGLKASITRKTNPNWRETEPTSLEYYLKKGMTLERAKESLKERQTTFTIEKCIAKYGKEEGIKKYEERQSKWLKTLDNLPNNIKTEINRKRKEALERYQRSAEFRIGYSKISQTFAEKTYGILKELFNIDYKDVHYATHNFNKEYYLITDNKFKLYDFAIVNNEFKIIIEYHGIAFHPRYNQIDFISPYGNTYEDIYFNDDLKKKLAIKNGFDYYCFYEDENFVTFIQKLFKDMYEKSKN